MVTTKVYRLEEVSSVGIYAERVGGSAAYQSFVESEYVDTWDLYDLHISPFRDKLLQENLLEDGRAMSDFFFCFRSMAALHEWIPHQQWLANLHSFNIKLAIYHCPTEDVVHGDTQSMFASHISKRQYDIRKYFKLE